jgi:hypothetical protein
MAPFTYDGSDNTDATTDTPLPDDATTDAAEVEDDDDTEESIEPVNPALDTTPRHLGDADQ